MVEASKYHNPEFDDRRQRVHGFVAGKLDLNGFPVDNIALANHKDLAAMRRRFGEDRNGGYSPKSNVAIVAQMDHPLGPRTSLALAEGNTAHEIAHGGSHNTNYGYYVNEAIPGIVEEEYLKHLEAEGLWSPSHEQINKDGILIPPYSNYADSLEAQASGQERRLVSSGLIAVAGLRLALERVRMTNVDLLEASKHGGEEHVRMIEHAVESLEPGLFVKINHLGDDMNSIQQGAVMLQAAAHKHKK